MLKRRFGRPVIAALVALLSFVAANLAARAGVIPVPTVRIGFTAPNDKVYVPSYEVTAGTEIVMVYIGKASCAYCQAPELPGYVDEIRSALLAQANRESARFVALALALDWSPADGYEHLRKFGGFDEVAAGRSWTNSLAMKYIWNELPGPAATPQVIVLRRRMTLPSDTTGGRYMFEDEHVVRRAVGLGEVGRLARSVAEPK